MAISGQRSSLFASRFSPLATRAWLLAALLVGSLAGGEAKLDPKYPFRTDWANAELPWYQPKPGEFPPHHSDHRVGGELIAADYIHRFGTFRTGKGELVDFTMPPYGTVYYFNAEADLRDVPLGTFFLFFLNQDEQGGFTKLATMQDEFTMVAGHGFVYHLDQVKLDEAKPGDGKLLVTKLKKSDAKPETSHNELLVDEQTRVWKGEQQIKLADLAVGDELLVSLGAATAKGPRRCADVYVGAETHQAVSERQRKQHTLFIRERGVPAWIDQVDGKKLTVTMISSEPASLRGVFKDEGIDPAVWVKEHRYIHVVVANEQLRSYWPQVTKRGATVREQQNVSTDCYGCSGVRWVIEVESLLEGFRVGRCVRLFLHPSWQVKDAPFGEGLHAGGHDGEEPPEARELEPADFPYRTDFGNPQLPWYQLQPGKFPPEQSAHQVLGELVSVDSGGRAGRFRSERGGGLVDFTLLPFGATRYLDAEAELADVPLGTRCRFFLHPDPHGAFTKASMVMDEYTWLVDGTMTYRVEAKPEAGRLLIARNAAAVKVDYQLEKLQPPPFGRVALVADDSTRVWKGEQQVKLADIAVGDELLINLTGRTFSDSGTGPIPIGEGRCTDLWIGVDTHKQATEKQRAKHRALLREHGVPAWIDAVDGKKVTIAFFAGNRAEFPALLDGDPRGKSVVAVLADDELRPRSASMIKLAFKDRAAEGATFGNYGCSGVRWVLEADALPEGYHPGQIVRVGKMDWAMGKAPSAVPAKIGE